MNFFDNINYTFLLCLVIFSPLVGAVYAGFWGHAKKSLHIGVVNSLLLFVSFIASVLAFIIASNDIKFEFYLFDWMVLGDFHARFAFILDSVSATMILVVSLVSFVVHIYSIGYMSDDDGFNRYFSYLSGFVFSMMILVMSDNFLGLFVGWEGVGLCSYLLIGFWYTKRSANFASIEAFVMNRIADLGMLLGILMIYWLFGSLTYSEVFDALSTSNVPLSYLVIIGALLFIGAMGKSAQFPLHTWLANAMEGPTPVSALIHAATMVTAGVYLVIRANPLYDFIPNFSYFIAYLGAFVAVFGASMAMTNQDLKKIIAYSTLSQLGYMFVAAGIGAYWVAFFHLFTHAFFKSLLFLGAGNIMHAMEGKLDITKMGGLYKPLKATAILMTIASIALCGFYPFAGFFSKDKILEVAFGGGYYALWGLLLIGAGMTAFYSFKLLTLVFFAPKNHDISHPHEAKHYMLYTMIPLAILAIISGFFEGYFSHFISLTILAFQEIHTPVYLLITSTTFIALFGAFYAIYRYRNGYPILAPKGWIHRLLSHQYYIPQFYQKVIIVPYGVLAEFLREKIEFKLIDASVDGIGRLLITLSKLLQFIQSGNLTKSLRLMSFGVFVMLFFAFISFFEFWR